MTGVSVEQYFIIIRHADTGVEFKRQGPFSEKVAEACRASIESSMQPGTYTTEIFCED